MTFFGSSARQVTSSASLVFDTTALSHFARADRLGELRALAGDDQPVLLAQVADELARGVPEHPALARVTAVSWFRRVALQGTAEVAAFARYQAELGGPPGRNLGEAAVLAWVSFHGGTAIIDDKVGRDLGIREGLIVRRTLWLLLNRGYKAGTLDRATLEAVIDDLNSTGMRLPVKSGADLFDWAAENGLLP